MNFKIELRNFEIWLDKISEIDHDFFSAHACSLLKALCFISGQDFLTMFAFLNLNLLDDRFSSSKLLLNNQFLTGQTANAVISTATLYLHEYVLEFHFDNQQKEIIDKNSLVTKVKSCQEQLELLYRLEVYC